MKKEVLRTSVIHQGRVEMSEAEFKRFLAAIGYKPRKGGVYEVRLESEVYTEDGEESEYMLKWHVKCE